MSAKKITSPECVRLISKYSAEIRSFSGPLSGKFQRDNQLHGQGAFSDLEGCLLYSLIRELKPELIYEISPNTGLSTNYIVLALQANEKGRVVGFELEKTKTWKRINTWDAIRQNQVSKVAFDKHYELVVGDAIKKTAERAWEIPDITLIDSCHEEFFARWYLTHIIDKTRQLALIQDITFSSMMEKSGEAEFVRKYIEDNKIGRIVIDKLDADFSDICTRREIEPIRRMRTNSILVSGKELEVMEVDDFPSKSTGTIRSKADYLNMSLGCSESQFESKNWTSCISIETDLYKLLYLKNRLISSLYSSFCKTKDINTSLRILGKVLATTGSIRKKIIVTATIAQICYSFPLFLPRLLLVSVGLMNVTTP